VDQRATRRREADLIPKDVEWIQDRVKAFDPTSNAVDTEARGRLEYDFLVVAAGLQLDWERIEGLPRALETPHVSSIYEYGRCDDTWRMLRSFAGGTAVFTCPPMPIKCAGAPQKIAYMAADHIRRRGLRSQSKLYYATAMPVIFGVKEYADELVKIAARHEIEVPYRHNLVAVDPEAREAIFQVSDADGNQQERRIHYDLLHVVPPQSAPDFVKQSPLAATEGAGRGWMEVDKHTLQHPRFDNVFGLGDVTTTPNAKTAAAVRSQVPVLVQNLVARMADREGAASYGGYGACPLVTGYGSMLLAEFDYTGKPTPSFFNRNKESYPLWLLKRYGLPQLYWQLMMRGIC
jgi:sulfide:quinone oxidoreductase